MAMTVLKDPETGCARYTLDSAGTFEMPALAEVDSNSIPATVFTVAVERLASFADKSREKIGRAHV